MTFLSISDACFTTLFNYYILLVYKSVDKQASQAERNHRQVDQAEESVSQAQADCRSG